MALTANVQRTFELALEQFQDFQVKASSTIYEGSAVGDAGAGYVRALVAADPFKGFACRKVDNSSGADGDLTVRCKTKGHVVLDVTGVASVDDEDSTVYASADGTFTLTSTSNTAIGKVSRWITGTTCVVAFESLGERSI